MRRTTKYVQACNTARAELGLIVSSVSHDELYQTLEAARYSWSARRGKWELQERPVTSSMFGAAAEGSGVYRLRCMAHPSQIDGLVADVVRQFQDIGYVIDEISGHYPNRRGIGTRVYLTMTKAGN